MILSSLLDRALDLLLRTALLLPSALVALLVLGGLMAKAEAPGCGAASLLPEFRQSGEYAALERAAATVPNGEGRLYRLTRDGRENFLFGTMHLSDPRILALPAATKTAFDAAHTVVIETTDILDGAMAQLAILARTDLVNLPAGKTLADYLDPAQKTAMTEKLGAIGIPLQSVQTLQPWFIAAGMMIPACEQARMTAGAQPLDMRLALDAKAAGKTVLGLEGATEQLEVMASMPMALQVDSLLATLAVKDQLPAIFETMIELYLAGDIAMIQPLSETVMPKDQVTAEITAGYKAFDARIITQRNHTMAERMRPMLEKGGAFVAVGALHLPGEEGLVALLAAVGYRVERLD